MGDLTPEMPGCEHINRSRGWRPGRIRPEFELLRVSAVVRIRVVGDVVDGGAADVALLGEID